MRGCEQSGGGATRALASNRRDSLTCHFEDARSGEQQVLGLQGGQMGTSASDGSPSTCSRITYRPSPICSP